MTFKEFVAILARQFSRFVPKRKNLWLFGAWAGRLYSDNSKYLYEYINREHPEINALWITREKSICDHLKESGNRACMRFSIRGVLAALRGEVAFITSGVNSEISPFVNSKYTKVIQLWHGVAPKRLGWINENGEKRFSGKNTQRLSSYYWMAASEKNIEDFNVTMHVPRDRFYITGYPRNDTFVNKPKSRFIDKLRETRPDSKLIIYMPTHRNFGQESITIDDFCWLDRKLAKNNIVMVYKPHYFELKHVLHRESEFRNIVLAKEQDVWGDPYSYIHDFDLLISDYSSISYDFLCSKKPIVLFTYDLERYKTKDAGLCDYFESMPLGPFCFTWNEVMEQVVTLLQSDSWKNCREECRLTFHPFDDGCNSQRVYETVLHKILGR